MEPIVNKVAESALTTLDLEDFYPKTDLAVFDLKDYLFMGLILKEKDFRASLQALDWEQYREKYVTITCTADAIIPMWAYVLVASNLQPVARQVFFGSEQQMIETILLQNISRLDGADFTDKRVVLKGCGEVAIPESAYVQVTTRLRPYVKSIMYGEACSTVPIFKRK